MDELVRELEERCDSAQHILGGEHPLTQFIRNALESGDLQLLQAAKAACDGGHEMLHPWTNLREPTREELLEEYARKPVRCFLQVDGWEDEPSMDSVVHLDEEGHVLMSGMRYELRNTDLPLRVQIYEGSDKEAVLTLLSKAHTWLERGWERLTTPSPSQTPDKQRTEEERIVRSEEQGTEEQRSVPNEMHPAPPVVREPVDGDAEPPREPAKSLSSSVGDSREQAQELLERVFVLNVEMVKFDPEEVARAAAARPKYIEAYIEVADQGIEWFTKFRDWLVSLRRRP
jgi:hypothetical protein